MRPDDVKASQAPTPATSPLYQTRPVTGTATVRDGKIVYSPTK